MIIKFLPHGKGSARKAEKYLLALKDHKGETRPNIKILRGDPRLVGLVADSLDFENRYTSCVLNWGEDRPTAGQIEAVLDSFEKTALAGLAPNRYCWTAVQHDEPNGKIHVHIVGARVDLQTGKSLNIAPPGWKKLFGPWRDCWNWHERWARPDDPARARTVQPGKDIGDIRQQITSHLEEMIVAGVITDRAGIVSELE